MFGTLLSDREKGLYLLLAVLLLGLRFLHWGAEIDNPHAWRQCDTAYYIQDFYENGIDLLHPEVCWMGSYGVTALEFPLSEAIVAVAYHIFGEDHRVARAVFLLFFVGAVFFLWKIMCRLYDERIAWLTSLVFMALPISLFYSRAIHIDFTALMLGLWGVNELLKGFTSRSWHHWLLSSILLSLALMIKAPIMFAMVPLLAYLFFRQPQFWRLWKLGLLMLIPLISFIAWRAHVAVINGGVPDWSFLPGHMAIVNMSGWYFGSWEMRTDGHMWGILLSRLSLELGGVLGLACMVLACFVVRRGRAILLIWIGGTIVYLLVFFPLNFNHDYYQIPLLPCIALGAALLLSFVSQKINPWLALALLVLLMGENIWRSEFTQYPHSRRFYTVNELYVEVGNKINAHTDDSDLLILSDPFQDPRNPTLMYQTGRKGWVMNLSNLSPDRIRKLKDAGATQWVILTNESHPYPLEINTFLTEFPQKVLYPFSARGQNWQLEIRELQ